MASIRPCRYTFSYHYHRYIIKTNMPHTTHPSPAEAAIRPATFADIDDLVAVYKASAPLEKSFHYKYPHVQQYPEDLIKHEKLVHHLLVSPKYSDYHVMVAEAPSLEDVTVSKIIAYAVWDVSYRNKRQYGSQYKSQNGKGRRNPTSASVPSSFSEGRSALLMRLFSQSRCDSPVGRSLSLQAY